MLADLDPRDACGDRIEFAADLSRRLRLHIPQVDVTGPAEEEQENARVPLVPRGGSGRRRLRPPPEEFGDREPQDARPGDVQPVAAMDHSRAPGAKRSA